MVDTEAIKEKEKKKRKKRLFTRYFGDQIALDITFQNSMIKFIFIQKAIYYLLSIKLQETKA